MRKLLVLIAALMATTAVGAADYGTEYDKYKAWLAACDYTQYTCTGITPPKVVRKPMRPGLLGTYRGGDVIYINKTLGQGTPIQRVLMHEMVHYLQAKVGGLQVPGPAKEICAAEAEAFTQVDKWLIDVGRPDLVVGKDWWKAYTHCYEWYKPNFTPIALDGWGWLWPLR